MLAVNLGRLGRVCLPMGKERRDTQQSDSQTVAESRVISESQQSVNQSLHPFCPVQSISSASLPCIMSRSYTVVAVTRGGASSVAGTFSPSSIIKHQRTSQQAQTASSPPTAVSTR